MFTRAHQAAELLTDPNARRLKPPFGRRAAITALLAKEAC
jgi:hypothetical protein